MAPLSLLPVLAMVSGLMAQKCPIQFDGRLPTGTAATALDAKGSPFDTQNVIGAGLKWSQIAKFPNTTSSLFDKNSSTAVEVTISDASIFNNQTGFRRAEFLPASNNGSDASTIGIKTLHFSLMRDSARPLNFSHEYQLVFVETADFSTNQFALKTGTIGGRDANDTDSLVLQSNVRNATDLHTVPFTEGVWHNYALTLDFTANTTQVFYSQDNAPLASVTGVVANDVSGRGQFHFGMLKKPTGEGLTDVTKQGFQGTGINEGIIYGGILQEDSTGGCISLSA